MNLHNKTLLITGANRGIGAALVNAALEFGARKVYASARSLAKLPAFNDERVVPLELDITQTASITAAVAKAGDVNMLINNAGVLAFAGVLTGDFADLHQDMNVNYFATLAVTRAFYPLLSATEMAPSRVLVPLWALPVWRVWGLQCLEGGIGIGHSSYANGVTP